MKKINFPRDAVCICGHRYAGHGVFGCLVRDVESDQMKAFADRCFKFKLDNLKYLEQKYDSTNK